MSETLIQILVSSVVAIVVSLLSLQAVRIQEKRLRKEAEVKDKLTETENADKIATAALKLLAPYEERLAKMQELQAAHEKQIKELECDLKNEREKYQKLEELVRKQNNIIEQKDARMGEMQAEIDKLHLQVAELQSKSQ